MSSIIGLSAALALLSAQPATGVNAQIPAEMASTLADTQQAVEEARFCLADHNGPELSQFWPIHERSTELQSMVRSLWGRQANIETEVNPGIDCGSIPSRLALAKRQLDVLTNSFATHSAPFNTGVWIGTMPLCSAGSVEARKTIDEYTGENVLQITLNKAETADLAALTTANVGNQLAIRVDGKLVMEPYINEPILGGSIQVMAPRHDLDRLAALLKRCRAETTQNSRVIP